MGQGKSQVQGRGDDSEFYFPAALEKAGTVPSMPCSASGTLSYTPVLNRWVSSEPARTRAALGSLRTEGLQGARLYRPESEAQEHFSLDLILWENDLGWRGGKVPLQRPMSIPLGCSLRLLGWGLHLV